MARKSRIEPRKNIAFLSENDFEPKRIKILQNPENCQISQTGKGESFLDLCCLHSTILQVLTFNINCSTIHCIYFCYRFRIARNVILAV